MASEFPVDGDKLKKLVKKSRAMPIAFGFNPGTSDDDDEYLAAHARKQPEVLGKLALSEGAGTKSAFGTFAIADSELHLTCFRTIPSLAKKFKKYLKRSKITLNVVVRDPDGNVIDTDVETLDDWFVDEGGDDDDDDDGPAADVPPTAPPQPGVAARQAPPENAPQGEIPAAPPQPGTQDGPSGQDVAVRLARLRPLQAQLAGLPPEVAARLGAALKAAVGLVRDNRLPEADRAIDQIEAALARLAAQQQAVPTAPPEPPQTAATDAPQDPRLPRLQEVLRETAAQVAGLPPAAARPLGAVLAQANTDLKAGETEAALSRLREVRASLQAAQDARGKWDKAQAMLAPLVDTALASGQVADAADLRRRWDFAVASAGEGGWAQALAAVPPIAAMLRAGASAPAAAAPGAVPQGVVAFQKSRVLWVDTRRRMLDEAGKLVDSIVAASTDDDDAAEIADASRAILDEVAGFDERLQDVLDQITNAEGSARDGLKRQAAGVVAQYRALLGSDLFRMIDANPFAPVAVAASARAALDSIARTLA